MYIYSAHQNYINHSVFNHPNKFDKNIICHHLYFKLTLNCKYGCMFHIRMDSLYFNKCQSYLDVLSKMHSHYEVG